MKEWMPIEAEPRAHSNGNGAGPSGSGANGAASTLRTLSVDAPPSPAGSGSIHPAFLAETKPEDLWKKVAEAIACILLWPAFA